MAKKTIPVDRERLAKAISDAESGGPLVNQTELFKKVAELYGDEKVTYSVVGLRIRDWNLEVKTPKGRRGLSQMSDEQKAAMQAARGSRKSKAERFEESDVAKSALDALEAHVPERFRPMVEAVRKGSRTVAVKLHCLDCSGYQTGEVRRCRCLNCSLWLFRPYQGALEEDEASDDSVAEDQPEGTSDQGSPEETSDQGLQDGTSE